MRTGLGIKSQLQCSSYCPLSRNCKTPMMEPTGRGKLSVLFIAESPGVSEDEQGEQLIGKSGQYLRECLQDLGVNLDDCRKTNSVDCRPLDNAKPEPEELANCRPRKWKEIERFRPNVVILLGGVAIESFFGGRFYDEGKNALGITRWRGFQIPDQKARAWVCPTFHPSFVLREKEHNPVVPVIFRQDLKRALALAQIPAPIFPEPIITSLFSEGDACDHLSDLIHSKPELLTFDYETTGLKPHRKGHRIVCCSTAVTSSAATSFLMSTKVADLWRLILKNPHIGKMGQNTKFEYAWSDVILHQPVVNIVHDTMTTAHVEDNRRGVTGLKFQAAVRWGVYDYSSSVAAFLKPTKQEEDRYGANAFNRIDECPLKDLVRYCGFDSAYEHREAMEQMGLQ